MPIRIGLDKVRCVLYCYSNPWPGSSLTYFLIPTDTGGTSNVRPGWFPHHSIRWIHYPPSWLNDTDRLLAAAMDSPIFQSFRRPIYIAELTANKYLSPITSPTYWWRKFSQYWWIPRPSPFLVIIHSKWGARRLHKHGLFLAMITGKESIKLIFLASITISHQNLPSISSGIISECVASIEG